MGIVPTRRCRVLGYATTLGQETEYVNGYTVMPAGKKWLADADECDYLPIEPGRFSKTLDGSSSRFGAGFQERAEEAISPPWGERRLGMLCHVRGGSRVHLLAVAIANEEDEQKIEKAYLASDGRKRIESSSSIHSLKASRASAARIWAC